MGLQWFLSVFLLLVVSVQCQFLNDESEEKCGPRCQGEEYQCVRGQCYCAVGFVLNPVVPTCIECPDLGDQCFGQCCSRQENVTLHCWHGTCQQCRDPEGGWMCRDTIDNIMIISIAQIATGAVLILGIVATLLLLCKLCTVTHLRIVGDVPRSGGRLSVGSLQVYVDQRLRDAPPRYSRALPPDPGTIPPTPYFINAGFVHDSSVPPPAYSQIVKDETPNTTLHV